MPKMFNKENGSKKKKLSEPKPPPVIIALRISRAAAAIDVSEPYLYKAIEEGRLKAVTKRANNAGRCVKLIMVDELRRFAAEDEGVDDENSMAARKV